MSTILDPHSGKLTENILHKMDAYWRPARFTNGANCPSEGTFREYQMPLLVDADNPDHTQQLESWTKSYKPEELFDEMAD